MMAEKQEIKGVDAHLKRLRMLGAAGEQAIPRALAKTAMLGVAEIQKIITSEAKAHSGAHRTPPQGTVTDLVDTGHYRANWHTKQVEGGWAITTNTPYALALEYGLDGPVQVGAHQRTIGKGPHKGRTVSVRAHTRHARMPAFFVVRRAKIRIRQILRDTVSNEMRRLSGG